VNREEIFEARDKSLAHLRSVYREDVETVIADARYGFISGLIKEALRKPAIERRTISDSIDKVLVNRWLGIPIFLAFLFGVFQFTFTASEPLIGWIDEGFGWLADEASSISPQWLGSFIGDGIFGGLGSVLMFVPPIFLLFIALALLEDCGYLARAAFIMDRLMHWIGLHGRSFIPLMLGFGCNVPAIMATRTIENPRDRLTTILITPFMSCGARLPIYILFAGAFFTAHRGLVVFSMYAIGIILAIVTGLVLRKTLLRGPSGHFVMELPPYRLPTITGIIMHTWERGKVFLARAGTIIFCVVVLVWLLDYAGALEPIGRAVAHIFSPLGFGQWQAASALVFGFLAKEVIVGTFGTLFAGAEGLGDLGDVIGSELAWTPLIAFGFMTFCLIYVPCVATIAIMRRETNSWRWPAFTAGYTIVLGWIVAMLIYQIGGLFGL
jgi:ferrous iron transport protein B